MRIFDIYSFIEPASSDLWNYRCWIFHIRVIFRSWSWHYVRNGTKKNEKKIVEEWMRRNQKVIFFKDKLPDYLYMSIYVCLFLVFLPLDVCVLMSWSCRLNPAHRATTCTCGTPRFKQDPRENRALLHLLTSLSQTHCISLPLCVFTPELIEI